MQLTDGVVQVSYIPYSLVYDFLISIYTPLHKYFPLLVTVLHAIFRQAFQILSMDSQQTNYSYFDNFSTFVFWFGVPFK